MAELKTKENNASVHKFIELVENTKRKADLIELISIIKSIGNVEPKMWGDSIIGFGSYNYTHASGRTGNWFKVGISPRKTSLTIYVPVYLETIPKILEKLGLKHGKGCLYIKSLEKTNIEALTELIEYSFDKTKEL